MSATFPFAQFEFAMHIGPPAGRYMVRAPISREAQAPALPADDVAAQFAGIDEPDPTPGQEEDRLAGLLGQADVLVMKVHGASPARPSKRFGRRAPHSVDGHTELSLTVATVIKGTELLANWDAVCKLANTLRTSTEEQDRRVEEGLWIVNRAVTAYRACAADPYVSDLTRADAVAVRVGYGSAHQLKDGNWEEMIAVPPPAEPRMSRASRLMPTQGMAAVLAGRARTLESEHLILRVLLDLEHDRLRAAATGLQAAHALLVAELGEELLDGTVRTRFDGVNGSREAIAELAQRAITEPLSGGDRTRLDELAEDAGALVDAWRYQDGGR